MSSRFESFDVPAAVAVGGALGALGRWALALAFGETALPAATFVTNIVGCFALGIVLVVGEVVGHPRHRHHRSTWVRLWRPFFATGVLGGFTTFSTFALEATELDLATAALYVTASLSLGLGAYALGNRAARAHLGVRA